MEDELRAQFKFEMSQCRITTLPLILRSTKKCYLLSLRRNTTSAEKPSYKEAGTKVRWPAFSQLCSIDHASLQLHHSLAVTTAAT
ncbi:hypothetical protein C5167_015321 [Papaver somniferum]|uniref:Uncharacterized protein n=1 Tax=Papaver somniferum TaxID=3469 RepID=A0A4Y7J9L6_PAPSO|nr:hypothetical protein C5167_015321 [Papaver somniferum]